MPAANGSGHTSRCIPGRSTGATWSKRLTGKNRPPHQPGGTGAACHLGRHGAAVSLLLTDQAMLRPDDPVRQPGYFRAMVNRARTGELNLQGSVFGILKRQES